MNDAASKLFNEQKGKLEDEYSKLSNAEKNKFWCRYNIRDLFLDDCDYSDFLCHY